MTQLKTPQLLWWKTATGYQIYPRSFADSNGDGIGDIVGIINRLDHLADLGIGFIWLSPVYASPMVDNGYDISDYRDIAPEFGTLADMDALIAQADARGIKIVMDLVVNHCSDQHTWFQTALRDPTSPEHDYFIWRDGAKTGEPPSDHQSFFGGSMWTHVPALGQYYLHQFAKEQPDLNWQNPDLRAQIYDMMNWWFDRGIGGFRMDVIDLIGKDVDAGVFAEGPDLHRFLQEMHRETLAGRDVVTVGESWSVSPDTALLYCGADRQELDMVFQFSHVTAGWHPQHGKWHPLPDDLARLKATLFDWQATLADDGWNALFWSNHDLPRAVSKYGNDDAHRVRSAKALALALHLMRGTPYVYQGEEIGMTNVTFERMDQFRDIETFGFHAEAMAAGRAEADFIAGANVNGRDNARTPMQWSDAANGGFSSVTPWIDVNPNHTSINVQADRNDSDGVFEFYRHLIGLRKTHMTITTGDFTPLWADHAQLFAYERSTDTDRIVVIVNLSDTPASVALAQDLSKGHIIASTIADQEFATHMTLEPYAGFAVQVANALP